MKSFDVRIKDLENGGITICEHIYLDNAVITVNDNFSEYIETLSIVCAEWKKETELNILVN